MRRNGNTDTWNVKSVSFLEDNQVYYRNQIEIPHSSRRYGIVEDDGNFPVCEYAGNGTEPQIVRYRRR